MITIYGSKVTANEFAKFLMATQGADGIDYWFERYETAYQRMTQREVDAVEEALEKAKERVFNLLGYRRICDKVYGCETGDS